MPLYAFTIFFSAFLLFLVQPVMAKQILPWFGGSATVWTTCLVFFQAVLLLGYAYADGAVRSLSIKAQVRLHTGLLALSCLVLPIVPGAQWKPLGTENPTLLILGLLGATIGLPYLLLSTTSPLLQAWFAQRFPGRSPYRLFALSNLASMLALVGYPFLLEPWVPTRAQSLGWSVAYVVFVLLCMGCGWFSLRAASSLPRVAAIATSDAGTAPTPGRQLLWGMLAATSSFLLLAVSNHICQNISAIPLLWVVPLSIYLITFILCFEGRGWYQRDLFAAMLAAALGVMGWTLADRSLTHELRLQIGVFCLGLFIACMFCHGELARLKPAPRYLTRFYLMISAGGAVGAALVGLLAPVVLPAYFERFRISGDYVQKPLLSREGANVAVYRGGEVLREEGSYGAEGYVYQGYVEVPKFGNGYTTIGSWIVGDQAAGIGIREDDTPITRNTSRFVPHYFT